MSKIWLEPRPFPQLPANYQTPYSNPDTARTLSATKRHSPPRRPETLANSPSSKMARQAMADNSACSIRLAQLAHRSIPCTSASPSPTTNGKSPAPASPSDESSQSRRPHNSPAQYQSGRSAAAAESATVPACRTPAPYQTASSPDAGYLPSQLPDGKSCAAHPAATGAAYVH